MSLWNSNECVDFWNMSEDYIAYVVVGIKFGDALPTPWRTQMWVQTENNGKVRSRGILLSSQHFGGVEGRAGAPEWD